MSSSMEKTSYALYYYRFKESPYYAVAIFTFALLIAVLLFIFAVIPQFQNFFVLNDEIKSVKDKITILKNNKQFLNTLNDATLQDDLSVSFSALPSGKDFVGIITAINYSAAKSGVAVDDYSLLVGELATPSAGLEAFFPLSVEVTVHGDKDTISNFATNTQAALPLSEIESIETDHIEGVIKLKFYYKVYKGENYSIASPIAPISAADEKTLGIVRSWRQPVVTGESIEVGTEAAILAEPF